MPPTGAACLADTLEIQTAQAHICTNWDHALGSGLEYFLTWGCSLRYWGPLTSSPFLHLKSVQLLLY